MQRKRFIAGAVCPECKEMDKMVVYIDSDVRACIACGFSEERPVDNARELQTRVNRASARRMETPVETVTLIDPKATRH